MHSFFLNSELEVVSELVSKPYKNDTDRNDDDVADEILEITSTLLNSESGQIGNYRFIKINESLQNLSISGKLVFFIFYSFLGRGRKFAGT